MYIVNWTLCLQFRTWLVDGSLFTLMYLKDKGKSHWLIQATAKFITVIKIFSRKYHVISVPSPPWREIFVR